MAGWAPRGGRLRLTLRRLPRPSMASAYSALRAFLRLPLLSYIVPWLLASLDNAVESSIHPRQHRSAFSNPSQSQCFAETEQTPCRKQTAHRVRQVRLVARRPNAPSTTHARATVKGVIDDGDGDGNGVRAGAKQGTHNETDVVSVHA